jgi:hypothetical protein
MIATALIFGALAIGYAAGRGHRFEADSDQWIADMRRQAMAPAFAIDPPTLDLSATAMEAK